MNHSTPRRPAPLPDDLLQAADPQVLLHVVRLHDALTLALDEQAKAETALRAENNRLRSLLGNIEADIRDAMKEAGKKPRMKDRIYELLSGCQHAIRLARAAGGAR